MPAPKSRELLLRLLQGETPTEGEITDLVAAFAARQELEGQWFDLKAGKLLQNKQGDELRAAVCGFANAEGGFLLLGYDEGSKTYDGVEPVGQQAPEHWAQNALGAIAHEIRVPRFRTVPVAAKRVLLVAVERARALVYVIEKGVPVYYLRFGHQTLPMPHSLIADLMLGRRTQPELRVTRVRVRTVEPVWKPNSRSGWMHVSLLVDYENDTLTLAEIVRCGLVGRSANKDRDLPQQLRRSVDLDEPPDDLVTDGRYPWGVQHLRTPPAENVEPFTPGQGIVERWALPLFRPVSLPPLRFGQVRPPEAHDQAHGAIEAKAALYLIAKNTEPLWWQLTMRYDIEAVQQSTERLQFEPCFYSRPIVSLRFLGEAERMEFPQP